MEGLLLPRACGVVRMGPERVCKIRGYAYLSSILSSPTKKSEIEKKDRHHETQERARESRAKKKGVRNSTVE